MSILKYLRNNTVLFISFLLALISCFLVKPDFTCIDWRVLALLYCLMTVVSGWNDCGLFSLLAKKTVSKVHTLRPLVFLLVMLCFFTSMLITNDVALITFVPFALFVLKGKIKKEKVAQVVVLQTIAANMGSCLTPMGNPQNLYLYSLSGMGLPEFLVSMLPLWLLSFLVLCLLCFICFSKEEITTVPSKVAEPEKKGIILFSLLFVACLGNILHLFSWQLLLAIVVLVILVFRPKQLLKADFSLLLTFVFFFVFVGNLGRWEPAVNLLSKAVQGKEVLVGALSSQIISNVPAAILLSGFTNNLKALTVGVNIGGLGTLIASMASLISFRLFAKEETVMKKYYLLFFSALNFALLGVFLVLQVVLC